MPTFRINGIVKPTNNKKDAVYRLLNKRRCLVIDGIEEGTLDFIFTGADGYDLIYNICDDLAPLLQEGKMYTSDGDDDGYNLYTFTNGRYVCEKGVQLIYYESEADDFVKQLPENVIKAVLKRYGGKHEQLIIAAGRCR